MSFLDKLNRRIAARVHRNRPRILVEGELVLLSSDGEWQVCFLAAGDGAPTLDLMVLHRT